MFPYDSIELDDHLTFAKESITILAKDTRKLHSEVISMVKVQ